MKYQLTKLINSLTKEEIRNFKTLSSRYQYKGEEKKLTHLFDYIKKSKIDEYDDKLVVKLFPKGSKNSYYQLKKRLITDIENSLVLLYRDVDESAKIFKLLQLSTLFQNKSIHDKAKKYLDDALDVAKKNNRFDLIGLIYNQYLQVGSHLANFAFEKFIHEYKLNEEQRIKEQDQTLLLTKASYDLYHSNFSGKNKKFTEVLQHAVDSLNLDQQLTNKFKIKVQIKVRRLLLAKQDFNALAEYLEKIYTEFILENVFDKNSHKEKIMILNWIINANNKLLDFRKSEKYINLLWDSLHEYNQQNYQQYIWTYHLCQATNYSFTNRNKKAIELLHSIEKEYKNKSFTHYDITVNLNLATLYYSENDVEKAIEYINNIMYEKSFKTYPFSMQVSYSIVELILRVSNSDYTYSKNLYQKIRRKYRKELGQDEYVREKRFLEILRDIIQNKGEEKDTTDAKITTFLNSSTSFEPGSNEAINYTIWLKSYFEKRNYYDILLEEL